MARHSPAARAKLEPLPLPPMFAHLWLYFLELSRCRSYNGPTPNPISHADLEAWLRLTGRRLSRYELEILRAIDGTWLFWKPEAEEGDA